MDKYNQRARYRTHQNTSKTMTADLVKHNTVLICKKYRHKGPYPRALDVLWLLIPTINNLTIFRLRRIKLKVISR